MTTTSGHLTTTIGFLERHRQLGTAMTLLVLVGVGVGVGGVTGMLLVRTVHWLLGAFEGGA